ncbi:DUF4271 domain-containing protein [Chryseobacterium sp. T1]
MQKKELVRIPEYHDWVIFCILGCVFVYIFSFRVLHRDANLKDFMTLQKDDSSNIILSWMLTSVVVCVMLSVLLSQFVPVVPKIVSDVSWLGYELNKFGYTFMCISGFYLTKSLLSYFYYSSLGCNRNLINLYLTANKFYFLVSLVLIGASLAIFYFPIDEIQFLYILMIIGGLTFILKIFIYLFNNQPILPKEWYYKFLYICTLQIVPLLVLIKLLF